MKKPTLAIKNTFLPQNTPGIPEASTTMVPPAASPVSIKSFSSSSSLSGTSSRSSSSRSLRRFKATSSGSLRRRARLLPKAHKRGGKDKPIVVRDSSSEEMLFQQYKPQGESGIGLRFDENDFVTEAPCESEPGPVETLNELRRVLQLISNKVPRAGRKRSKKSIKMKKSLIKSSSTQDVGHHPEASHFSFVNISGIMASNSTSSQGAGTDVTALDVVGGNGSDSSAPGTEDVKTVGFHPCSGPTGSGNSSGTPEDEEGLPLAKPSAFFKAMTSCENCQEVHYDGLTLTSSSDPASVKHATLGEEATQDFELLAPSQRQMNPIKGSSGHPVKPVEEPTSPCTTPPRPQVLCNNEQGTDCFPSLCTQTKNQQTRLHEIWRTKRLRHRDRTPQRILWGKPKDDYQPNPLYSSSILAQTLTGFHSDPVKITADTQKYEESVLLDNPAAPGFPNQDQATKSIQDFFENGELGGFESNREGAGTAGGEYLVIPRAWLDENKLEAQSIAQLDEATGQESQTTLAFNPVATASLLLSIVTYPLKVVWRIAYGA